jgi:hypothetical protein
VAFPPGFFTDPSQAGFWLVASLVALLAIAWAERLAARFSQFPALAPAAWLLASLVRTFAPLEAA